MSVCANCAAPLAGRYGSDCGQRRAERISFRRLGREVLVRTIELDWAIAETFKGLTLSPGGFCRDYVDGRRRGSVNPAKYAFLAITIDVRIINLLEADIRGPWTLVRTERELQPFYLLTSIESYLIRARQGQRAVARDSLGGAFAQDRGLYSAESMCRILCEPDRR